LRGRRTQRSFPDRTPLLHLANHEKPQSCQKNQGSQIEEPVRPTLFGCFLEPDIYPVLLKSINHCRLICRSNDAKTDAFGIYSANDTACNRDRADLTASNPCQEIGIANLRDCPSRTAGLHRLPEQERAPCNNQPENRGLYDTVHTDSTQTVAARYGKFRPVCSGLPNP
jgi:hypothetical protein